MTGWTKLFSSIVTSSVWCEDNATLRVWIAMLATADAEGIVEGSIPGFANLARVTVDEMRLAVEKLSGPDSDSRTPDHEGRRIEVFPGGWHILNYQAYREKAQAKEGSRAPAMRRYRARKRAKAEAGNALPAHVTRYPEERGEKRDTETDSPKESSAVVVAVPAPPAQTGADDTALRYLACFNAVFGRRLSMTPKIRERVRTRLHGGYRPWQLVALPVMVDAQGVPPDMKRTLGADVPLRDGRHPRTGENGTTYGATDWLERALGRLDQTVLDSRLAEIAKAFGVLEPLMAANVGIRQDTGL
jgi:hypothetical protein